MVNVRRIESAVPDEGDAIVDDAVEQAAGALLGAYASGVALPPLQETFGPLAIEDAYQIQLRQVNAWLAEGRNVQATRWALPVRPCSVCSASTSPTSATC